MRRIQPSVVGVRVLPLTTSVTTCAATAAMPLNFDFDLVTCFRYDPKLLTAAWNSETNGIETPYLLFKYHFQRLVSTTSHLAALSPNWERARTRIADDVGESGLRELCDAAVMKCLLKEKDKGIGMRVLLASDGQIRVETHPIRPLTRHPFAPVHFIPPPPPVFPSVLSSTSNFTTFEDYLENMQPLPQPIFQVVLDSQPLSASSSLSSLSSPSSSSSSSSSSLSPLPNTASVTGNSRSKMPPLSLFTNYKTTYRVHYDSARARAGIHPRGQNSGKGGKEQLREVLVWNELGEIMEGSVRNVAFWRRKERSKKSKDSARQKNGIEADPEWGWVCPPLPRDFSLHKRDKLNTTIGLTGLPGTVQRYLLEQGLLEESEKPIKKEEVRVGDWILLSNGWEGTVLGVVVPNSYSDE